MSKTKPYLSACRCVFKRTSVSPYEDGIAIGPDFGVSDVQIIPDDYPLTILPEVYNYHLDWTHSIDGDALFARHTKQGD